MAGLGREAIYAAFFAQLSTALLAPAGPLAFMSRKPFTVAALGECQYPAMYCMEAGEIYDRSVLFVPARVSLLMTCQLVAVYEGDEDVPSTLLNNLADLVEDAIENQAISTAQTTLGGLVQECWINHRQAVLIGNQAQRFSQQTFMVEMVLPHSR